LDEVAKPQQIPLGKVNQSPIPASPVPQQMPPPYPQHIGSDPFPRPSSPSRYSTLIPAPFPESMEAPCWPEQSSSSPMSDSTNQYTSSTPQYPPSPRLNPNSFL
jgi:hypothetical protein